MRFALIDSGLGVLPTAACIRRENPGASLILSMDPDGMPWGIRNPEDIARRVVRSAEAALRYDPDILICASNTGSTNSLDALKEQVGTKVSIITTLPSIYVAVLTGEPIAIWATPATMASRHVGELITRFAAPGQVTRVPCPGFAEAVESGDDTRVASAVSDALDRTPQHIRHVILGCTQYELAVPWIMAAKSGLHLYATAHSVASEALRRCSETTTYTPQSKAVATTEPGELHVLLSGREGELPVAAYCYAEGRAIANGHSPRVEVLNRLHSSQCYKT